MHSGVILQSPFKQRAPGSAHASSNEHTEVPQAVCGKHSIVSAKIKYNQITFLIIFVVLILKYFIN